jgi:phosphatidylinositol-3-phosphatase
MARRVLPALLVLTCALASASGETQVNAAVGRTTVQCGGASSTAAVRKSRPVPRLGRVVVLVMENKGCEQVIGSAEAPYLNRLARKYAFASRYHALTNPSLPNYIGLTSGSTFGLTTDCTDCTIPGQSIVDQLERAHISWKAYMDGMPVPCFDEPSAGDYVKKHNPFLYYVNVRSDPARCGRVVPLDRLYQDIARHRLPRFVWITPDECHDMHSCPVREGDLFLSRLVPILLKAVGPRGAIFVTWDEGLDGARCCRLAAGGHIPTIVAGPAARLGVQSALAYDHYSILRTIEDAWRLPRLRGAACRCTRPLTALLR